MRRNKRKRGITMKILHTADWHLGIDLHKVSLLEDQKYALWQIKKSVMEVDVDVIVIDSAHGHSENILKAVREIKAAYPELQVIAGNVATGAATKALIEAGVDAV